MAGGSLGPTELILPTHTSDPTGSTGSMYFNTDTGVARIKTADGWQNLNEAPPLHTTNGLVALYDWEDPNSWPGSGTTWYNVAPNSTAPNATMWGNIVYNNPTAGISSFYASNGGFDLATSNGWWNSATFTIIAWTYLHSYNSYNTGIISQYSPSPGRHNWMWTNTGTWHMNGCKGAAYPGSNGGTGTWRMQTLRYDNGYVFSYDDNVGKTTALTGGGDMCTSSTSIVFLARGDDHVEPANASIRKVQFYNRYLSDSEITENWNLYKSYVGR